MTDRELTRIVEAVSLTMKEHIEATVAKEIHYAVHYQVAKKVSELAEQEILSLLKNRIEDAFHISIQVTPK